MKKNFILILFLILGLISYSYTISEYPENFYCLGIGRHSNTSTGIKFKASLCRINSVVFRNVTVFHDDDLIYTGYNVKDKLIYVSYPNSLDYNPSTRYLHVKVQRPASRTPADTGNISSISENDWDVNILRNDIEAVYGKSVGIIF